MRRLIPLALGLMLMLAGASADQPFALGIGGYMSAGGGCADWTYDFDSSGEIDADGKTARAGLGLVLEVNPAGRSIFNYRLGIGQEVFGADFDFESGGTDTLKLAGVMMEQTFGFALLRDDAARLWIGPQVRAGFYGGEFDDIPGDVVAVELGIGGALGANFHIGDRFTISTVAGYRFSGYEAVNDDNGSAEGDISGSGGTVFFNLAFMARTGDDAR